MSEDLTLKSIRVRHCPRLPFSSHTREPRRVMFNALTSVNYRVALFCAPEQLSSNSGRGITMSTLEEEGKAAEGRRGNEGRGGI